MRGWSYKGRRSNRVGACNGRGKEGWRREGKGIQRKEEVKEGKNVGKEKEDIEKGKNRWGQAAARCSSLAPRHHDPAGRRGPQRPLPPPGPQEGTRRSPGSSKRVRSQPATSPHLCTRPQNPTVSPANPISHLTRPKKA